MSFEDELEAALIGSEPDFASAPDRESLVLDSDQATRWLAQLDSVRRKRAEVKEAMAKAVERMAVVTNGRVSNLTDQEAWLEEALGIYHEVILAGDPEGAMTITLPTGVLKSGKWGGDIWTYENEAAFEAWAITNLPGAVEYPEPKVKKAEAKKLINEATLRVSDDVVVLTDGTIVPGLKVTERPRAFKAVTPNA